MRIVIVAVGRARPGPARALYEDYASRLRPVPELIEVEERRPLPVAALKRREGELIEAVLARRAGRRFVVALDERGRALASRPFAERLAALRGQGLDEVAFLIGGADGLDDGLRERAGLVLSLGPMTWPHFLVRGLLAEQLYRAQQIAAGHPYHRA